MKSEIVKTSRFGWMCVIALAVLVAAFCCLAVNAQSAQAAGKAGVWVITKAKTSEGDSKATTTYSYDKNGLLVSEKDVWNDGGTVHKWSYTYKYDGKQRLKSWTYKEPGVSDFTRNFKADGKGRVTKGVAKDKKVYTATTKFSYDSKGRLKKYVTLLSTKTFKYDSKGRVTKWVDDNEESGKATYKVKYDSKGGLLERYYDNQLENTYKSTYDKNGNLVKQVRTDVAFGDRFTSKYTYKKVSVPKSVAKMVKAQQLALSQQDMLPIEAAHK